MVSVLPNIVENV